MKTRPLVMFCWAQVIVATAILTLNFYSLTTRPTLGAEYSRGSGKILHVTADGPAKEAGLAVGDGIVSLNGHPVGVEVVPLYFVEAGQTVPVVIERGGVTHSLRITPVANNTLRWRSFRAGGARTVSAIANYLSYPLHLFMISLGAALLVLRPDHRDARISALSLVYWAGCMFMFNLSGFGTVLARIPEPLRVPLIVIDAAFASLFFAVCLHFALIFPSERTGRGRWWEWLPYVAILPIFIEMVAHGMERLRGNVGRAPLPWTDAYSPIGALLLLTALVALAVRLRRMHDPNARRRVQLVFLSLLPGSFAFIFDYVVNTFNLGFGLSQVSRLLQMPATALGAFLYAYAVIRHRMYNIRVLVRRSLQYALARSTLFALMSLPVVGLVIYLYRHRRESLADLLIATPAVYLLLILPLFAVILYRKRLLEALDRRFFREQFDARRLLLHVVSIVRGGSDMLVISRASLDEIDKALHPKHISLWPLDPEGAQLHRGFHRGEVPAEAPPLSANGTLATLLANDEEPLDVHSRHSRVLMQRLPDEEREWLRQADAHLIVPLLIDRRLAGMMVLGERMSEEPFGKEDRDLLRMLGGQLALTLDYARLKHSPSLVWSPPTPAPGYLYSPEVARLCPRCGRLYSPDAATCDLDQQELVPEMGVPHVIEEKYVVVRLLGRGGMGSVYLATQKRLNRPVAIKVLLAHLVGSSSMRTRFEREARIVARLRHPAIVTIHDFGVLPSGHAYLVMEYLDGETLRKTITSGPQPLGAALSILGPVGEAIDAAHKVGVVHRDLKPENIMLVRDHSVLAPRVLDFGLAKLSGPIGEDEATLVQSGHSAGVVGTLMYMAPEILSGKPADPKSDQYSLALIAYELLAGEHPLGRATDLASVVRGHTETAMTPVGKMVADIPQHVADALSRALSKNGDDRFDTVIDFVEAMRRVG